MAKTTNRSLKNELTNPGPSSAFANDTSHCALSHSLDCCDGVGYRIKPQGAFLHAEICACMATCQSCFGLGRKMIDGVSHPCRKPNPGKVVNLLNLAKIPARYSFAKLDSFSNFSGNGRETINLVAKWSREFDKTDPKGLILGGPVGVGKTYLMAAITKNFAARGLSVRFIDFFQLLSEIKAAYSDSKSDQSILNPLTEVDVLLIDELGKGRCSDWELSIIDQIIMGRYNQNKAVVASTNYNLGPERYTNHVNQDLESNSNSGGFNLQSYDESLERRIGQRIYSRLLETCLTHELKGEDFRKSLTPKIGQKTTLGLKNQEMQRRSSHEIF